MARMRRNKNKLSSAPLYRSRTHRPPLLDLRTALGGAKDGPGAGGRGGGAEYVLEVLESKAKCSFLPKMHLSTIKFVSATVEVFLKKHNRS